ncbi:unnamed protein product [Heterobilharzia americana]|nr:unnamed protein product [Heterobilharzia americana]
MDHIHATKKFKCDSTGQLDQGPDKRKQVDAHVQAFLKAVLDHAHSGSFRQTDSSAEQKKPVKINASTQTDDYESCSYSPDQALKNHLGYDENEQTVSVHQSITRVPNREMYSEEAFNFLSQQSIYSEKAQEELTLTDDGSHNYSTQSYCGRTDHGVNPKSSRISSSKIKRAINEWVKKYEDWFFQNFGMDVRTASHSFEPKSEINLPSQKSEAVITSHALVNTVSPTCQMQNSCVVSHSPVSYLVPEGSLCTLDSRFSPYYSLVPSFYISPAFGNIVPALHSATTAFDLNVGPPFCPNSMIVPGFIPSNICASISNTIVPLPPNVQNQINAPLISVQSGLTSSTTNSNIANPVSPSVTTAPNPQHIQSVTFADLPSELQTSAMLATLALPVADSQHSLGQWGPRLKYGTYGRLPSSLDLEAFNLQKQSSEIWKSQTTQKTSHGLCAAAVLSERGRELFLREKESYSGLSIDFVKELSQVVDSSIGLCPKYIFTRISDLSPRERSFYVKQTSNTGESYDVSQLFACDLLIGDVLVAESLSMTTSLAKICAARQAFQILSRPCFLVGSVRQWEDVEYLVLCLSPKAEIVPKLPPFLDDPFESNLEKDNNEFKGDENITTVFNPKPFEDMWIYLARLPREALNDQLHTVQILAQSAEFSQMVINFEFEVQTITGQIVCNTLIDNQRCLSVESENLYGAQRLAMRSLLDKLCTTQPVIGLSFTREDKFEDAVLPLWGIPEHLMVENLMWGKEELDSPVHFEQLEAHCDISSLSSPSYNDEEPDSGSRHDTADCIGRFTSSIVIERYLQAYAASALVSPVCILPHIVPISLWPIVQKHARRWGLLSRVETRDLNESVYLIVCKRVPLPRLKKSLYENQQYGCFCLLDRGNLTTEALKRMAQTEPLCPTDCSGTQNNDPVSFDRTTNDILPYFTPPDPYIDEPVTRLAREFVTRHKSRIKTESNDENFNVGTEDCVILTAELNQPSNAIEILDDLPKTLIPGIDF